MVLLIIVIILKSVILRLKRVLNLKKADISILPLILQKLVIRINLEITVMYTSLLDLNTI